MSENMFDDERWEDCEICDGKVDTFNAGYYKTPDERFRHELCHKLGEVPPQYELVESYPNEIHITKQYNCGHSLHSPPKRKPSFCPRCNPIDVEIQEIELEQ